MKRIDSVEFFRVQQMVLEALVGSENLSGLIERGVDHPAVHRWQLCRKLIEREGDLWIPEDRDLLPQLGQLVLDSTAILACTGGSIRDLRLGLLANYGDPKVHARVRSVAQIADEFLDLLTELSYAAWNITRGYSVLATEDSGKPDFQVTLPDLDLPVAADCKRLKAETAPRRIKDVIHKANQQIKSLGRPVYGIAALDISERIPNPEPASDEIPLGVMEASGLVRAAIARHNSSISGVLLIWDDYFVDEEFEPRHKLWVASRRRSLLLRHEAPLLELPMIDEQIMPGFTHEYSINLAPRRV